MDCKVHDPNRTCGYDGYVSVGHVQDGAHVMIDILVAGEPLI